MRTMLKSKIHRARVTGCNISYEGSISIDKSLLNAADVVPFEKVDVLNINNGARFSTYAIESNADSGEICVNGAAARLAARGDIIIILTYHEIGEEKMQDYQPRMVYVDAENKITHTKGAVEEALNILRNKR